MRKILSALVLLLLLSCVPGDSEFDNNSGSYGCGSYNGHSLYKGSKGGCYYYNSKGSKVYVDRSRCNC